MVLYVSPPSNCLQDGVYQLILALGGLRDLLAQTKLAIARQEKLWPSKKFAWNGNVMVRHCLCFCSNTFHVSHVSTRASLSICMPMFPGFLLCIVGLPDGVP